MFTDTDTQPKEEKGTRNSRAPEEKALMPGESMEKTVH